MRGKPLRFEVDSCGNGITPAGAGKTKWFTSCPKSTQDHPRRCGENIRCSHTNMHCLGSPPQVRGKLNYCKIEEQRTGITPAGAGKTLLVAVTVNVGQHHPRRCGENTLSKKIRKISKGSPPQVRGKQLITRETLHTSRITPAGAGKTSPRIAR